MEDQYSKGKRPRSPTSDNHEQIEKRPRTDLPHTDTSDTLSSGKPNGFHFLDLPGEIRNRIYEMVLVSPNDPIPVRSRRLLQPINVPGYSRPQEWADFHHMPSITRVNRRIREECATLFYGRNIFTIYYQDEVRDWTARVDPSHLPFVKTMVMEHFYMPVEGWPRDFFLPGGPCYHMEMSLGPGNSPPFTQVKIKVKNRSRQEVTGEPPPTLGLLHHHCIFAWVLQYYQKQWEDKTSLTGTDMAAILADLDEFSQGYVHSNNMGLGFGHSLAYPKMLRMREEETDTLVFEYRFPNDPGMGVDKKRTCSEWTQFMLNERTGAGSFRTLKLRDAPTEQLKVLGDSMCLKEYRYSIY